MAYNITDIITRIQRDKRELGITLYDKVCPNDIIIFEQVMNVILPDDFRAFYSFSNGFESAEDMFRLLPLDEIIENKTNGRDTYLVGKKDFHIAEYMIYCDMWTIAINNQDNNNYLISREAGGMSVLTNSLADFLNLFLDKGVYELYQMEGSK